MPRNFFCIRCGNGARQTSRNNICRSCNFARAEESRHATRHVTALIRSGAIKKAKEHICVDCGKQAFDYDHRDYLQPTIVQPVCRGCNQRRGPALDSVMRYITGRPDLARPSTETVQAA